MYDTSAAIDSVGEFVQTFVRPRVPPGEVRARLRSTAPPFHLLSLPQLVPAELRAEYLQLTACLQRPLSPPVTARSRNASRPRALDQDEAAKLDLLRWMHPKNAGVEEVERRGYCWQIQ